MVDWNHLEERIKLTINAMKVDEYILEWTMETVLLHMELCFDNDGGHLENDLEWKKIKKFENYASTELVEAYGALANWN